MARTNDTTNPNDKATQQQHPHHQQSRRIQHEYFAVELDESGTNASGSSNKNRKKSPFSISGAVESIFINQLIDEKAIYEKQAERKRLIELLHEKHMNHYIYYLNNNNNSTSDWRSATYLSNAIKKDIQTTSEWCRKQYIQFNLAMAFPANFDLSSEGDIKIIVNQLQTIYALVDGSLSHITLLFHQLPAALNEQQQKSLRSLGNAHSQLMNTIIKEMTLYSTTTTATAATANTTTKPIIQYYLYPLYSYGDFDQTTAASLGRQELEYWIELNKSVDRDCSFFFNGPGEISSEISSTFVKRTKAFFRERRLLLWDYYPPSTNNCFLAPYQGREPPANENDSNSSSSWDGVVIQPLNRIGSALIPLCTAFDFIQSPSTYLPTSR